MRVLVTGGAGYVGSHTARWLLQAGHDVWVLDNLSQGHRAATLPGRLIVGDLIDRPLVEEALRTRRIEAVVHFAGLIQVGESVIDPAKYYWNNVTGSLALFEAMRACSVGRIVFSSTAAVYGNPRETPITEDSPLDPVNPYGFNKLAIERALADYVAAYGWGAAALRYFNACGATPDASLGEDHHPETHLIPLVLQAALGQRPSIKVFGRDYPTPDGTCIRDYIHVEDLASAHHLALERLSSGQMLRLNLGTGQGHSVEEVIAACRTVTGRPIVAEDHPRRAGDAAVLVADSRRAQAQLAWQPRYMELPAIIETAWRWHRTHPQGYAGNAG